MSENVTVMKDQASVFAVLYEYVCIYDFLTAYAPVHARTHEAGGTGAKMPCTAPSRCSVCTVASSGYRSWCNKLYCTHCRVLLRKSPIKGFL